MGLKLGLMFATNLKGFSKLTDFKNEMQKETNSGTRVKKTVVRTIGQLGLL